MSGDHLERLEAMLKPTTVGIMLTEDGVADLRAAVAELKQARAQLAEVDANQPEVRDTTVWCWHRNPDHPLRCGRFAGHEGQHARGERRWDPAPQQPESGGEADGA